MKKLLAVCISAIMFLSSAELTVFAAENAFYEVKIEYTGEGTVLVNGVENTRNGNVITAQVEAGTKPTMQVVAGTGYHTEFVQIESESLSGANARVQEYQLTNPKEVVDENIEVIVEFKKCNVKTTVVEPTCQSVGYSRHVCVDCGAEYTDSQKDKTDHQYVDTVKQPTCTEKGYTLHKCSICGYEEKINEKPALGHTYEDMVVEPTCTEKGYTDRKCTVCGHEERINEKPALGHSYKDEVKNKSCLEDGYTTHTCTVCGDKYTDNKQLATGHDLVATVVAPTKTSMGYTLYTCKNCDYVTVNNIVPMLPAVMPGEFYTTETGNYYINSIEEGNRTAIYMGPADKDMTKVVVPASVTISADGNSYKVIEIAENAFANCKQLRSVHIGNNVLRISNGAFSGCSKLAKVQVPNSVTEIGDKAFYKCSSLLQVTLGNSVRKIGAQSFSGCKKIKTMSIKTKRLTTVGSNALKGIPKTAKIKVVSGRVKTYTKLLNGKGQATGVKVVKL